MVFIIVNFETNFNKVLQLILNFIALKLLAVLDIWTLLKIQVCDISKVSY